jgi:hypothetical protein
VTVIPSVTQVWVCPKCKKEARTRGRFRPNRYHRCPRLHGVLAPMVPAGAKADVVVNERQDYIGRDIVDLDERGHAPMSVSTHHADGRVDTAVFAPHIRVSLSTDGIALRDLTRRFWRGTKGASRR